MASVTPHTLRNTIINYISTLKSTTYVQVDIEKVVKQSDGSYEVEGTCQKCSSMDDVTHIHDFCRVSYKKIEVKVIKT